MLWLAHDRELRQVVPAANDVSDGRPAARAESEQGLERCHGCLAPVMAKDEFVEITLQLMTADAVVIDTTEMAINAVVQRVMDLVAQRQG